MHNIGSSCMKPSLTGLCSRVHNSDKTQLTHLKFCTHVNKHLFDIVCKNNFITSYCFLMLPNILEYTFFLGHPVFQIFLLMFLSQSHQRQRDHQRHQHKRPLSRVHIVVFLRWDRTRWWICDRERRKTACDYGLGYGLGKLV